MQTYVPPSDDEEETSKKKVKKTRAKKDKDAPKGAVTSYIIFATEMRAKV